MAFIVISERVKPLLSSEDEFELKLHSSNKATETITVLADGDLFTFKVNKDEHDHSGWYALLYSSRASKIVVGHNDALEYGIRQIITSPTKTTQVSENVAIETPIRSDNAEEKLNPSGGTKTCAAGCQYKRIVRDY